MSFRLVRNHSEKRCWTSQHDRNKDTPQQRLWGIENYSINDTVEHDYKKGGIKMKKIIVLSLALFLIAITGSAYAKGYEVKKKAGAYDVEVRIDKNPPVVGDNNVTVEIKDASGKNVTDAKVKVEYSMPAMPGMPAMNYKTDMELKGSEFKAKMNLSMSGPWNIALKITRGGKTTTVKFNVDAH